MSDNEKDAPAGKPAPRLLGKRSVVVPLTYPVEFDGRTISEITITRMTGAQVAEFMSAVQDDAQNAHLPMYDVPQEVVDALDADDADVIEKATFNFLPLRLRPVATPTPGPGADTSPSSGAS